MENMALTRQLCGKDFEILSGDDDKTYAMMVDPRIEATGAISVVSNVAPRAVADMIHYVLDGDNEAAAVINKALQPLFSIVTVKTQESTPFGPVNCRARNPLAFKTLMNVLGMPSGPCRQPLGRMSCGGLEVVLAGVRRVYEANPQVLEPIADYFGVNLKDRLYNKECFVGLVYA
jgi:4-hydroxy-tetrahydrodipicolinate synthase